MDKDFGETLLAPLPAAAIPAARSGRYDFEVPEHLTVSDMLAIQLANCVRISQTLSDQASDPRLHDTERLHTIQSLGNIVEASEKLTRSIGQLRTDTWDDEPPRRRSKR